MNPIESVTIRLVWEGEAVLRPAPHLLRGAIAGLFPDSPLLHQHEGERCLYRYPLVQYRWDQEGPLLFGIGAGAQFLAGIAWAGMELRLGQRSLTVRGALSTFRRQEIRPSSRLLRFQFATPWLPFSQENYTRYQALEDSERAQERDRLAVAGLLVALRGCGVEFPGRLYAACEVTSVCKCPYKGVTLLGLNGNLVVNVDLPEGFAIGRAISHGYGWLVPGAQARGVQRA